MKKIYLIPVLFFLSSCGSYLSYIGSKATPTKQIDVYVNEKSIKLPYEIIGKGYLHTFPFDYANEEVMQDMAVKKAKAVGADAVLFQEYVIVAPASITTVVVVDSVKNGVAPAASNTGGTVTKGFTILFLKYTK